MMCTITGHVEKKIEGGFILDTFFSGFWSDIGTTLSIGKARIICLCENECPSEGRVTVDGILHFDVYQGDANDINMWITMNVTSWHHEENMRSDAVTKIVCRQIVHKGFNRD